MRPTYIRDYCELDAAGQELIKAASGHEAIAPIGAPTTAY